MIKFTCPALPRCLTNSKRRKRVYFSTYMYNMSSESHALGMPNRKIFMGTRLP